MQVSLLREVRAQGDVAQGKCGPVLLGDGKDRPDFEGGAPLG